MHIWDKKMGAKLPPHFSYNGYTQIKIADALIIEAMSIVIVTFLVLKVNIVCSSVSPKPAQDKINHPKFNVVGHHANQRFAIPFMDYLPVVQTLAPECCTSFLCSFIAAGDTGCFPGASSRAFLFD